MNVELKIEKIMGIPIVKNFMDDGTIYDIISKALDILPCRKELAIWSEDETTAKRVSSLAAYHENKQMISSIRQAGCKVLLVYREVTMLPFDPTVEENLHEYYKTFGW